MKTGKCILIFKKTLLIAMCLWGLIGLAVDSVAADKAMICAAAEAVVCSKDGECFRGSVDKVNLPLFFKIDLEGKKIFSLTEGGQIRTSPIVSVSKDNGVTILQGAENGSGWSMIIQDADGTTTLSSAKGDTGFIVYGACTTRY